MKIVIIYFIVHGWHFIQLSTHFHQQNLFKILICQIAWELLVELRPDIVLWERSQSLMYLGLSTVHRITCLYGSRMMVTGAVPAEASRHIHL